MHSTVFFTTQASLGVGWIAHNINNVSNADIQIYVMQFKLTNNRLIKIKFCKCLLKGVLEDELDAWIF